MISFPADIASIEERIRQVDPVRYAATRNHINGRVSYLSPYISRGVIALPDIRKQILSVYKPYQSEKFIQELAWREYFQRVWQEKGDAVMTDLKYPQADVLHYAIPAALMNTATSIDAIDTAIQNLYSTGYMHNHLRMYTAMLSCNIGKTHWHTPAQWMYYHLLDGDIASNHLSWQWVAGSFSAKKYYTNQENINRFTGTDQVNTFLDIDYGAFEDMQVPEVLKSHLQPELTTPLPQTPDPVFDFTKPLLIYNSYQIDPDWRKEEDANRILLLEHAHFKKFPVSARVLDFILSLARTLIPDIQIVVKEIDELPLKQFPAFHYKEHPLTKHYGGNPDPRDWLFPQVTGYWPSFSAYWNKCRKYL
jgi:deoxyribodipyrimidine photo-lyase